MHTHLIYLIHTIENCLGIFSHMIIYTGTNPNTTASLHIPLFILCMTRIISDLIVFKLVATLRRHTGLDLSCAKSYNDPNIWPRCCITEDEKGDTLWILHECQPVCEHCQKIWSRFYESRVTHKYYVDTSDNWDGRNGDQDVPNGIHDGQTQDSPTGEQHMSS